MSNLENVSDNVLNLYNEELQDAITLYRSVASSDVNTPRYVNILQVNITCSTILLTFYYDTEYAGSTLHNLKVFCTQLKFNYIYSRRFRAQRF